jgi:hypothetical protein
VFENFLRGKAMPAPGPVGPESLLQDDGVHYAAPGVPTALWLAAPYQFGSYGDLGARLAQLYLEGFGSQSENYFVIPWADLYSILGRAEFDGFHDALLLPKFSPAIPRIASHGAIADSEFNLLIDGWVDMVGRPMQPMPRLHGRILRVGDATGLVQPMVHQLLTQFELFHATPTSARTREFRQLAFGRIRRLASDVGCPVSDYITRTIILTPDKLNLRLEKAEGAGATVVRVSPDFEDAPMGWLGVFDRLPISDQYDVADGASLVRVILTPDVKAVLHEVKRMPGRRVAGDRAEAFVRNPFAMLGDSAHAVLDGDQIDRARTEAGLQMERFMPIAERRENGAILRVGVSVERFSGSASDSHEPEVLWFSGSDELSRFVVLLDERIASGAQSVSWRNRSLELLGDAIEHHAQLVALEREWSLPAFWSAAEVFDLRNYSERIAEIGIERPFVVPVIVKNDEGNGWFEGNVTIGLKTDIPGDAHPVIQPLRFEDIPALAEAVKAAEEAGRGDVPVPGLLRPVPIEDARAAVDALLRARQALIDKTFDTGGSGKTDPPRKRLVLKRNIEEVDYNEQRAGSLLLPPDRAAQLPTSLRSGVSLKPHQMVGVAWLQHLWEASPHSCRGTVLADDMGLGKTLQLLCFMASCFEADPQLPPALVVAPVALLENWRNEIDRFFEVDALPVLTLYGQTLKSLRTTRQEVDEDLQFQGVTRLLKKKWVGDARVVLTTYETMRDMEFALASQQWSIMVCDEAQKIKTPAAMVTRSAKKQKVRFRVACTGTPVENTLADLWCLFDFVQPGMLGALTHFSRNYRQPIEAKTEAQQAKVEELREVIKPQILHRKKIDVAKDLPTPVEERACKRLPMTAYQQRLYEGALNELREQRATNPSAQLQALLAIRKICSDPHGFAEKETRSVPIERLLNESPKMGWLIGRLQVLALDEAGDHKVIVFCEFRELQLMLQRVIAALFGFAPSIVNGDTSADPKAGENRQKLIDAFQQKSGFNVIILSPLAVGFGVNIQAANHVIHFTRTWNPAKEDQATARAYRIGQTRSVNVYYPGVVSDKFPSFDERLDTLLAKKRELAYDMLNGCSDLTAADFADFG